MKELILSGWQEMISPFFKTFIVISRPHFAGACKSVDFLKITVDDILSITQQYEMLCKRNMCYCILHNLSFCSQLSLFWWNIFEFFYTYMIRKIFDFFQWFRFWNILHFNLCETGLNEVHTQDKSGSNVDVFV